VVCEPCRRDNHGICPERIRQAELALAGAAGTGDAITLSLAAPTGQRCDCMHQPGRATVRPATDAPWQVAPADLIQPGRASVAPR
jgi:hypothetical protein